MTSCHFVTEFIKIQIKCQTLSKMFQNFKNIQLQTLYKQKPCFLKNIFYLDWSLTSRNVLYIKKVRMININDIGRKKCLYKTNYMLEHICVRVLVAVSFLKLYELYIFHSGKIYILTIFNGFNYIHNIVQPSSLFPKYFLHPNQKCCTH